MFSLTNKMVKNYINCLTFSKRKKSSSSSRKHSLNERFTKLCLAGKRFSLSLFPSASILVCVCVCVCETQASPAVVSEKTDIALNNRITSEVLIFNLFHIK